MAKRTWNGRDHREVYSLVKAYCDEMGIDFHTEMTGKQRMYAIRSAQGLPERFTEDQIVRCTRWCKGDGWLEAQGRLTFAYVVSRLGEWVAWGEPEEMEFLIHKREVERLNRERREREIEVHSSSH